MASVAPQADALVHAPEYRALPDRFQRWAMICDAGHEPGAAAEALLWAAWAAEDSGRDAATLRRRAASLWQGDPLRRIDILRRAGALAEAEALAASLSGLEEEAARIVAFQRARIAAGDTGRHLLSSALRPPAHNPHAAHGKPPARGLLARLFGR